MLKKNVEGIEKMAADWLNYRFRIYLNAKKRHYDGEKYAEPAFIHYCGATALIEAIGGEWRRNYRGDNTEEALNNPENYSHWVLLPSDERCKRLNFNAWED